MGKWLKRTVHADYPYPISHSWVPPYRFLRINELLGRKEKMSVEDMQLYQADQYAMLADRLTQILGEVDRDTEDLQWAVGTLQEWDRQMTKDSAAADYRPSRRNPHIRNMLSLGPYRSCP